MSEQKPSTTQCVSGYTLQHEGAAHAPDGVACPTPAELRDEVERLTEEAGRWQQKWKRRGVLLNESRKQADAVAEERAADSTAMLGHYADVLAERDALQQQVANAKAEGWDECVEALAWCLDNGSPHGAPKYLHDNNPHRAALGGPASPTPEPTIADHDGFGAPIMDHAQEPQPTDKAHRLCCEHCQPDSGEGTGYCKGGHLITCPLCRATRQQEPVERITDDRGDELERGADTDAEAANQPQDGGA